jgi:hypothetical protein
VTPAKATTKAKPANGGVKIDPERVCPGCGEAHASSFVSEAELAAFEGQGVKASALPPAAVYRMFYCGGVFHAVPHVENEEG